jgi:putative peptide zinc metalloprotease protein
VTSLWQAIDAAAATPAPQAEGVYAALRRAADPAQYRPRAIAALPEEQVAEGGQTLTVLRSPSGSYLRLSPVESELWHAMDGTRTVGQLAVLGLSRFKQLVIVADLVANLRAHGFLADPPAAVYRSLSETLEEQSAEGWGQRALRTLRGRTFSFGGVDAFYTALYRALGWVFFTRPALALFALVAAAGFGAFLLLLYQPVTERVFEVQTVGGLVAFWAALLMSFVLHESAHALAVKHYGRQVPRGGVMLYYGMPAAFVDTSDIWMAGRKARIVVSAAGPLCDLLVGGVAALAALLLPEWGLVGGAYRLAVACYLATLFNLNPLLELDGYFILVDALRLPDLRRRALAFVGGPLWQKLRKRERLGKEDRFFGIYGLLTAAYTLLASALAFWFWRNKFSAILLDLWTVRGVPGRVLALLIVAVVIVPIAAGLLLAAWAALRAAATWLRRRGHARRPAVVASVLAALAVTLALWAPTVPRPLAACVTALLWAGAQAALLAVLPDYRGAAVWSALFACVAATALALAAALANAAYALGAPFLVGTALAGIGLLLTMLLGFAALLDADLREAPASELLATAVLLALAFAVGAAAFAQAQQTLDSASFGGLLAAATPAYGGALALALLLPHLLALRDSRMVWSWGLLWLGVLAQTVAYVDALAGPGATALPLLAATLWAGSWYTHLVTLRSINDSNKPWPGRATMREADRLQRAFALCYAGCYRLLRAVYGSRRAKALDDRIDILAATANWDITFDEDEVRIGAALAQAPLDAQGGRYAEVLRTTVAIIEGAAGASFARRCIRVAYDALPWPEREAANRRCFPDTPWARELSHAFGDAQAARLRRLRLIDLFSACDDDELAACASALQPLRAPTGHQIIGVGDTPQGLWLVESGEIVVWRDGHKLEELHRGRYFGADELSAAPASSSYRATIESELLFLPLASYQAVLARRAEATGAEADVAATLRLLERVPLFADVPRHTLRGLAMVARQRELPARALIVREGVPSGTFYLIRKGRAAVVARSRPKGDDAQQALGPAKVVAQLGPEEFFGELELLRGTPPVASVISTSPILLLALPHEAITALISGADGVARSLEQVGTGRLMDLRSQVAG